jgi:hypothetical protein
LLRRDRQLLALRLGHRLNAPERDVAHIDLHGAVESRVIAHGNCRQKRMGIARLWSTHSDSSTHEKPISIRCSNSLRQSLSVNQSRATKLNVHNFVNHSVTAWKLNVKRE